MTHLRLVAVLGLVVMSSAIARAQEPAPAAPPAPVAPVAPVAPKAPPAPVAQASAAAQARANVLASIVPLKVTIMLSKYQGDKKVTSMPYELTVRTDSNNASIRMKTQVPTPGFGAPIRPPMAESRRR